MLRLFVAALALAAAPLAVRAADEENPYKNAKAGDYAVYVMKSKFGDATMTQTVSAKTDKEATVKLVMTANLNGKEFKLPEKEMKIDLTKPYDPTKGTGGLEGAEVKMEKDKEGKEKVKVGGKEYDATWTTYKTTIKVLNMELTGETKVWIAKDVPLGMVKTVSTMEIMGQKAETTIELKETGNKK